MTFAPVTSLNVLLAQNNERLTVGKLVLNDRKIWFQYDQSFLGKGIELSPFKLPLKPEVVTNTDNLFEGLFGLFNDSLPDGWGRLLVDRHMRGLGVAPQTLTSLDRLAFVGRHGMGALQYEPEQEQQGSLSDKLNLDLLAEESRQVLEGGSDQVIDKLLSLNGSSAGARPKIMVGVNKDKKQIVHGVDDLPEGYEHWIIKFISSVDAEDNGSLEYAYSLMAKEAGINMPETHLFPASGKKSGYFGVRRFDREGNKRIHVHTASGLLHADHRAPSLDYESILKAALLLTKSVPQVEQFFRLAAFNVMAHNRDDHAKNFSFIMENSGAWQVAPAYDLIFSSSSHGEHSTTVVGEGRSPGTKDLLKLAKKFDLKKAPDILEEVSAAVKKWKDFAENAGITKTAAKAIQNTLDKVK